MRKTLIAAVAVVASLVIVPSAFAWGGAKIVSVSCPEIHVNLPVEHGNWQVLAKDDAGKVIYGPILVPGWSGEQVVGNFYMADNATHRGTVLVGNAANISDGLKTLPFQLTNCAAPLGAQGPKGDPGVGYDCTGTAVPVGGTPALCPGTPGTPGTTTTIIVHEAPKVCTSTRKYAFKVRKYYPGAGGATSQKVVGATASEPGIADVKVTKTKAGRFLVTWSTTGKKFVAGGTVKTMNIRASLVARVVAGHTKSGKPIYKTAVNPQGPKHIRLVWKYRPCTPKDGNLNDPSAAGQGATGGA